jgi:signal transduction histidine kinase
MKDQIFRRLDLGKGIQGSGLGLTVVWEIVKRLNGRVWVEDRVEDDHTQGSTFVVELPRGEG